MTKNRSKRIPVSLPLLKRIRLALAAEISGITRTAMAEAIVNKALSNPQDWKEIQKEVIQTALVQGVSIENFVREVLKANGFEDEIDLEALDPRILFDAFFESALNENEENLP